VSTPTPELVDQEVDRALAAVQQHVNDLADPRDSAGAIADALDRLYATGADAGTVNTIHAHAVEMLETSQSLHQVVRTTLEMARALREQRERLRQAIADVDISVPEIEELVETIREETSEEEYWYLQDLIQESFVDEIAMNTGLNWTEAGQLADILTGGVLEDDHPLWDELREWLAAVARESSGGEL
jgi:sugar/nucleoside kinase (ribokinase family)